MEKILDIDDIINEINSISPFNHNSRCGLSFQRIKKVKADLTKEELLKIYHLVESHAPSLREKTAMRYERLLMKEEYDENTSTRLRHLKNIIATKCVSESETQMENMIEHIGEMPKEWMIIQLTSQYNPLEFFNIDAKKYHTTGLHISVFNCGQSDTNPFLVTVDAPEVNGNKIELLQKLMNTLAENRERLLFTAGRKMFKNHREKIDYYGRREETEQILKGIVKSIEENWLREWRCLLIGKYQDESIEKYIKNEIDTIIKNQLGGTEVSSKTKVLLNQITRGVKYLRGTEVLRAVQQCFETISDQNILKEICRQIKEISIKINTKYNKIFRHPIIIVVDEGLDSFPWEMLDVLEDEPVSRVPSLHFAYLLFKEHEKEIEEGHKIIQNYKKGTYIVNPDRDLENMENRMMSFYNYWVPDWKGIFDRKPTNDEFFELLTDADIFSYNGHGNGAHIMAIEMLQKTHVNAVALLFGCGSTRITRFGPQVEMYGSYHMYLISRCPCVLGMLWEVTDIDTDVLTTEFLSKWIPSIAPISWSNIDKTQWKKAIICGQYLHVQLTGQRDMEGKTMCILQCPVNWTATSDLRNVYDKFVAAQKAEGSDSDNLELLRALWHAKKSSEYFLTRAACVVRGLPVKIKIT